jgi:sodium-coupled monocarboxylate transporter 8/12
MGHLSVLDTTVMVLYMMLLAGVGTFFARQKRTLKTYLLADQNVHWIVVGISVMAALFSGISYLGAPAESFFYDLRYLWVVISFLIATPITTLIFLPRFRSGNLFTAYEYLERRFDWRLRKIASILFILRVTFYLGLAIYAPALAIMDVTGWPLWISVLATGSIATIYTAFGGMKAVIWTDTIQFIILCGGIFVILAVVLARIPGGVAAAWHIASADGKTQFFNFSLDPTVRITVWGALLGGTCLNLVQMVTDQVSVQRYITAPSLKDSQRALWLKLWVCLPVVGLFYLTGTMLYGYYRSFPDRAPGFVNSSLVPAIAQHGSGEQLLNDRLLPFFVTRELPSPLPGILIAAILGATIAVFSAGINALATTALIDLRPSNVAESEKRDVRLARILTIVFGVTPTLLALFVIPYFGSLVEAIGRIAGLFGGPLLGVFFLGALSRRANATGALIGAIVGAVAGVVVSFSKQLLDYPISFLWIAFVAAFVTYAVGILHSYLKLGLVELDPQPALHRRDPEQSGATFQ